jgi:hypothetical protein
MRRAAAIAEHHPEELYGRNRALLSMSREQLHEFASTPEKGLPERTKPKPKSKRGGNMQHKSYAAMRRKMSRAHG